MLIPNPKIQINVLRKEEGALFIDKPAGIPVHPGIGHKNDTLANGLIDKFPELFGIGPDPMRAGIVHRLDKLVSGVIVVARSNEAFRFLQEQFIKGKTIKEYIAVIEGKFKQNKGEIKTRLIRSKKNPLKRVVTTDPKGKEAITKYEVIDVKNDFSILKLEPQTGRMHQLRSHMSYLGHPILGDRLYGSRIILNRILLHALSIEIKLPFGKTVKVEAPLPSEFNKYKQTKN